jgi:hypothetical protein
MKKLFAFAALTAVAGLMPALASADTLLGSTVDVHYDYVDGSTVFHTLDSVVVTSGIELTCPGSAQICNVLSQPTQTLNIGDNSIRYEYSGQAGAGFGDIAINAATFESLYGSGTRIVGATLTGTSITGFEQSRVTFTDHSVRVNTSGVGLGATAFIQIDLQTAPVPEPATVALMLGGLGLLALRRRPR